MLRLTGVDNPQRGFGEKVFTMDEKELLTPKQESFCVHYTTIGAETFSNGTRAAIASRYSEKSAYSQACALLKNPKVRRRIEQLQAKQAERVQVTADKVLRDLADIVEDCKQSKPHVAVAALDKLARHLGPYESEATQTDLCVVINKV